MLIRTQSGDAVAEIVHAYISEMMGEKDFYIFGTCSSRGAFSGGRVTLGIYKSKEKAFAEIDSMTEFFSQNPNGVYKMR